jgi:2-methylcitrate dehydratase PrpD
VKTETEPHLARLGAWVAGLSPAAIPEEALRAARYQVLNMVAAAHAAASSPDLQAVGRALAAFGGGGGKCAVIASGTRLGPADAAFANTAHSIAHDFDDIVWMGHTCHSSVFAPLAVAEQEGASARDLLAAVVIANEIGGRLGASCFFGPLNGQLWSFIHLVGAAAATSKLLGLDAEKTTHALGIALAHPNFPLQPGFMKPSSKLLTAALPTRAGIAAAYLAREGMTGEPRTLEDRRGFWRRFSFLPLPFMLDGLGELWVMRTLSMKTFPGCFYFQTACSAVEDIQQRTGRIALDQVAHVRIGTTKLGAEVTRFGSSYLGEDETITPVSVGFDLRLTVAVLLSEGRLTSRELDPSWLAARTPELRRWQRLIQVRHDPALTGALLRSARQIGAGKQALSMLRLRDLPRIAMRYSEEYGSKLFSVEEVKNLLENVRGPAHTATAHGPLDPAGIPLYFPNRVEVVFKDGRKEIEQVDLPAGAFCAPDVERELWTKFQREVGESLGEDRARAAFAAGLRLGTGGEPAEAFVRAVTWAA